MKSYINNTESIFHSIMSSRLSCAFVFASVFLLTLYGVAQLVAATRWGVGLSPDSMYYILSARSVLENGSLKDLGSHYPPLYPMVLAIFSLIGIEVLTVARWTQFILYSGNISIFGLIIYQTTERAVFPTIIGCLLLVSSQLFLEIHAMAWSEPLFINFSLLGLFLLSLYFKKNYELMFLACSAFFFGIALITRYAGIAFVLTGVYSVLIFSKATWQKRCLNSALFFVVSLVPLSVWIIRNILSNRLATNREFVFHPVPLERLLLGAKEVLSWFQLPVDYTYLLAVLVAAIVFMMFNSRNMHDRRIEGNVPEICFMFIFVYIIFLLCSISFFDYIIPLNGRMLSPVYLFAFLVILILSHRFTKIRNLKLVGYTMFMFLVVNACAQMTIQKRYLVLVGNGIGYASKAWIESEVLDWLKEQINNSVVYSNAPEPVELYTNAKSHMVPRHTQTGTMSENEKYLHDLNKMAVDLSANDGYIIYFNAITWRWYLPTVLQLKEILPLQLVYQGKDGDVYKIKKL